jgi:hypothetical protein
MKPIRGCFGLICPIFARFYPKDKKNDWVNAGVIFEIEIKFFYQAHERFFSGCKCPSAIY